METSTPPPQVMYEWNVKRLYLLRYVHQKKIMMQSLDYPFTSRVILTPKIVQRTCGIDQSYMAAHSIVQWFIVLQMYMFDFFDGTTDMNKEKEDEMDSSKRTVNKETVGDIPTGEIRQEYAEDFAMAYQSFKESFEKIKDDKKNFLLKYIQCNEILLYKFLYIQRRMIMKLKDPTTYTEPTKESINIILNLDVWNIDFAPDELQNIILLKVIYDVPVLTKSDQKNIDLLNDNCKEFNEISKKFKEKQSTPTEKQPV